jgi:hypothetical protein
MQAVDRGHGAKVDGGPGRLKYTARALVPLRPVHGAEAVIGGGTMPWRDEIGRISLKNRKLFQYKLPRETDMVNLPVPVYVGGRKRR